MTTGHRTLNYLRSLGHKAAVVERWNPHAFIRQDLFGCLDIISLYDGNTYGWQTTTTNVQERVRKIQESPYYHDLLRADWHLRVIGWSKKKKKRGGTAYLWVPRIIEVGERAILLRSPGVPQSRE